MNEKYRNLLALVEEHGADVRCTAVPHIYFPDDENTFYEFRTAKRLCAECPILMECFDYAVDAQEVHGVWGGTTPTERKEIWRKRGIVTE